MIKYMSTVHVNSGGSWQKFMGEPK